MTLSMRMKGFAFGSSHGLSLAGGFVLTSIIPLHVALERENPASGCRA